MQNSETATPAMGNKDPERHPVSRFVAALHRLEDTLMIAIFLAMLTMAVLQIVLREVFSVGISWGDVLVRILVLWICLLGAMIATRLDKHIRIDVVALFMPEGIQTALRGGVRLFAAGVCGMMTWQGMRLVLLDFEFGTRAFARVPAWVCEVIIPFGFAVMALRYTIISITYFKEMLTQSS